MALAYYFASFWVQVAFEITKVASNRVYKARYLGMLRGAGSCWLLGLCFMDLFTICRIFVSMSKGNVSISYCRLYVVLHYSLLYCIEV